MAEQVRNLERRRTGSVPAAWVKTELARNPQRPFPMDFVGRIFTDFSEIRGDRAFGDDPVISCGMARFHGAEVMVVANLKGRTTKEKVQRNFGMPNPEGYRKALRAMKIAEKFGRPVFTFIDIPGAWHGMGAEERGQAEAIAHNLREMSRLRVPTIATITGEGGSGGALAIAVGGGEGKCASGASFAGDGGDGGNAETGHFAQIAGDGFGLATLLGTDAGV